LYQGLYNILLFLAQFFVVGQTRHMLLC